MLGQICSEKLERGEWSKRTDTWVGACWCWVKMSRQKVAHKRFIRWGSNSFARMFFCNINVLKILKILQQNYWILFAIAEGYLFMEVKKPKLLVIWIVYALLLFFLAALSGSSNRSRTWSHLRVWLDKWKLQFEIRSNGRNVCSVWISLYWLQNLVLNEDVDSYKVQFIYLVRKLPNSITKPLTKVEIESQDLVNNVLMYYLKILYGWSKNTLFSN